MLQEAKLSWLTTALLTQKLNRIGQAVVQGQISRYPAFIEEFEQRYASLLHRQYGLTFCNGTSAIEAALFALNIGPGDQVIVPSCTFHASIDPIVNAGAEPVFADVDAATFTLDPDAVARQITDRTRAVIVVHVWGFPADMDRLQRVVRSRGIALIEDVSHAHGASWAGRPCGSWGDLGVFSLQGSKAVAAGEGGIVVTDRRDHYLRMSAWGHFNRHGPLLAEVGLADFSATGIGYKRRMAPLGALLADVDPDYLTAFNGLKQRNADRLGATLGGLDGLEVPHLPPGAQQGGFYQGYPVQITQPGVSVPKVLTTLQGLGIEASAYPFPLHHKLPIYTDLAYRQRLLTQGSAWAGAPKAFDLPVTEALQARLILLSPRYLLHLKARQLDRLRQGFEQALAASSQRSDQVEQATAAVTP
jgi:dTDP-4-amino-4,6-dideoxygalactose transaminase